MTLKGIKYGRPSGRMQKVKCLSKAGVLPEGFISGRVQKLFCNMGHDNEKKKLSGLEG